MNGYIYFLINPSMPNLVKIGYSQEAVESRLSQLDTTGIPTPFILSCQFYVKEPSSLESLIHKELMQYRVNDKREFFSGSVIFLLKKVFLMIESTLISEESSDIKINKPTSKLSSFQAELLSYLTEQREYGFCITGIFFKNNFEISELELEYELECLRSLGYVELKKSRQQHGSDR